MEEVDSDEHTGEEDGETHPLDDVIDCKEQQREVVDAGDGHAVWMELILTTLSVGAASNASVAIGVEVDC